MTTKFQLYRLSPHVDMSERVLRVDRHDPSCHYYLRLRTQSNCEVCFFLSTTTPSIRKGEGTHTSVFFISYFSLHYRQQHGPSTSRNFKTDLQAVLVILSEPAFEKALETRFLASMKVTAPRFASWTKDRFSFRELLATVDLIIDPWPGVGGRQHCKLSVHKRQLSPARRDARSRFTLNAYMSLGLQDLVAHNTSHFVEIARGIATASVPVKRKLAQKLRKA